MNPQDMNPQDMNPQDMSPQDMSPQAPRNDSCPGNPAICAHSQRCIADSLNGWRQQALVEQMRIQLSDCLPCLMTLDAELQIRHALHDKSQEKAPADLRINISQALGKINLGEITGGAL